MSLDMHTPDDFESGRPPLLNRQDSIEDPKRHDVNPAHIQWSENVLASWEAFEHEPMPIGVGASRIALALLLAIVAYAVYTNSPLMAIVFILIGMVEYLLINRPPEMTLFSISTKGIMIGKEFYQYDNIKSFWILEYHPDSPKQLIIQTDGVLVSHVHIPLAEQHPDAIRDILLGYLPEKKYELGLIDTIEKILHI